MSATTVHGRGRGAGLLQGRRASYCCDGSFLVHLRRYVRGLAGGGAWLPCCILLFRNYSYTRTSIHTITVRQMTSKFWLCRLEFDSGTSVFRQPLELAPTGRSVPRRWQTKVFVIHPFFSVRAGRRIKNYTALSHLSDRETNVPSSSA